MMRCDLELTAEISDRLYVHRCKRCGGKCRAKTTDSLRIRQMCTAEGSEPLPILTAAETAKLFPGEDPTLLGNRIAALTAAIGIPECGGCTKRKAWLNKAHAWLRGDYGADGA